MFKSISRFLLLLLCFALPLCAASSVQYEDLFIEKIDILVESAEAHFDTRAIRASLETKAGNIFSQMEFDRDLKLLAEEYSPIEPVFQVINQKLYITLRLWVKPTVRNISFEGNSRFTAKKLLKELKITPGTPFDHEEFVKAFNKLKMLYVKKGYFEATLQFDVIPVEGCNSVDLLVQIDEGRAGRIQKIIFYGIDSCEEDDILDLIVTKKYLFLLSWISGGGCYHPDMIEHDRLVILNYLQDEGYADATVDIYVEEAKKKDRITLNIAINKGIYYQVANIAISGNTLFSDQEIYDQFNFYQGGTFSPGSIRATVQDIRALYGSEGYIDANIDVQLSLREDCPLYDVTLCIEEGEQYSIGMVRVFGNRCTKNRVILHENLLCPGEIFDVRKLEGTETRLTNTGYFKTVNVYAIKSPEETEDNHRDVYIEVEEADTGNIGIFAGFSSLDRLFGGVELTEQNFNIMGIPALLKSGPRVLRGNGEYLHAKANIGDKQTNYILQWTKPYFLDTEWIVGFDVEKANNRALSEGYEVKTYGGNVHATYIFNDFLKHNVYYRANHTNTHVKNHKSILLNEEAANTGFISAIGTTLIYDSTNNPRRPTCGFRSRLLYEFGGVGGNYQFMKFGYLNAYYYPLSKRGTFKLRADFQFTHTYDHTSPTTLPLSERYFLGGETTVRGYRPFSIGPKFGNNEPRGGVSSYLISEEYQYNLLKNPRFDAFCFVDAGFVSLSEFTLGKPAAAAGFGVRIEIMRNTPMTFGVGWPVHPGQILVNPDGTTRKMDNAQRFFFSMGATF